ncbi:hypothetical protein C8J57DRAFT_707399 [Mycena rebaudengoi]|nr:hypothetical protein C8J57DRAFT_707399 [Mycena rebaudengoi]
MASSTTDSKSEMLSVGGANGQAYSFDPAKLPAGSVVIMDNSSSRPFITTQQAMDDAIPDRGPLVHPCTVCKTPPPKGGPALPRCGRCSTTHYCSRQCQVAHWKEHKPICLERTAHLAELAAQRAAAHARGERFSTPITLRTWYQNNSSAVEYAAFHTLQLYKGLRASLQPTHIVAFKLRVDADEPEDAARVRFLDVGPAPLTDFARAMKISPAHVEVVRKSTRMGLMTLFFADLEEGLQVMEFHQPPSSEAYTSGQKQPDPHWRLNVAMKLNGGLPSETETK